MDNKNKILSLAAAAHLKNKILSLENYAYSLGRRLASPVPAKHAHRKDVYLEMLRIDLKKTNCALEKLKD